MCVSQLNCSEDGAQLWKVLQSHVEHVAWDKLCISGTSSAVIGLQENVCGYLYEAARLMATPFIILLSSTPLSCFVGCLIDLSLIHI